MSQPNPQQGDQVVEIFTKIGPILSSRLHVLQETVNVNVPTFIVEAPTDSTTLTQIRGGAEGM
ncbi:MAG: hypothetical protein QW613_05380, partial [Thermoprotei archaeon]